MPSIKEEFQRQQEIAELENIEIERQSRKASRKGASQIVQRRAIYYFRWVMSVLFLIASISLFIEDNKIGAGCTGLVLTAVINPITFEYFKSFFRKGTK